MQESRFESSPGKPSAVGGVGVVTLALRAVGAIVSIGLVAGIVYWAVALGQRDASRIPVIKALQGEPRITPKDPGGTQANYLGLAVNEVLAQDSPSTVDTTATIAPSGQVLPPEDVPQAQLVPLTNPATEPAALGVPAVEPTRVDAASVLTEVDENGNTVPPAPVPVVAPDGMTIPLRRPDSFNGGDIIDQLLQGLTPEEGDTSLETSENPRPVPPYGNPYLNPGDTLVQLGAYNSLADANGVWDRYQGEADGLLSGLQRTIEPVEAGGRLLYQLRAAGLADVDKARVLCAALGKRRIDCLPVTQK